MKTGSVETHPGFAVCTDEWFDHLETSDPDTFWIEEVTQFKTHIMTDGTPLFKTWLARCRSHGYHCFHFLFQHDIYIKKKRDRLVVAGFKDRAGGKEAATWASQKVLALVRARKARPVTPAWRSSDNISPFEGIGILKAEDTVRIIEHSDLVPRSFLFVLV